MIQGGFLIFELDIKYCFCFLSMNFPSKYYLYIYDMCMDIIFSLSLPTSTLDGNGRLEEAKTMDHKKVVQISVIDTTKYHPKFIVAQPLRLEYMLSNC